MANTGKTKKLVSISDLSLKDNMNKAQVGETRHLKLKNQEERETMSRAGAGPK